MKVQYASYDSVLVVNAMGVIRQVFCPFRVYSLDSTGRKMIYVVEEVQSSVHDELIYIIQNRAFLHHNFTLDIYF
jgi:hypothetical protein